MTPPLATNMAQLNEPYERFPTNELRRECYRRKLTIIKAGPLANATKAGFLKLLRESDPPAKGNDGGSGSTNAHLTLAAFHTMLDASSALVVDKSKALSSGSFPQLVASSPQHFNVVSPPPSPAAAASAPPPRPPRVDSVLGARVFEVSEKRGPSVIYGDGVNEAHQAKKLKSMRSELRPSTDSQSTTPSQTPTESTSVFSSMLSEPDTSLRVQPKTEWPSGATLSIVTRWERLFARLEAVNEKLHALRGSNDPWTTPISNGDASDVEFYTIMKRQLQKELLDCVAST